MSFITFDTSVIISRKLLDLPNNFLFSAVVLSELIAGASDNKERRHYQRLFDDYNKDNALIVPDDKDWQRASYIIYALSQERRKFHGGKAPRLKPGASQRMMLDALIAVSAQSYNTAVVTDNYDDFKAILRHFKFKLIKGSDFFKGT